MVLPQFAQYKFPDLNFLLTPLKMTGIEFLMFGLGCTGVPEGGSEEPGYGWLGSIGEPLALCFLRSRVTSVKSVLLSN